MFSHRNMSSPQPSPPVQVSSTIIATAVTGKIKNAQEKVGTPNRKLQTYLYTAPSVSITPTMLPSVVHIAGR